MPEYIDREKAVDALLTEMCMTGYQSRAINVIRMIEKEDVVPVVRCLECRHWTGVSLGMRCKLYSFPPNCWICTGPEDFCSRGEKPETRK